MATTPQTPSEVAWLHDRLYQTWANPPGIIGMLKVVNHTSIGLRFLVTGFIFFLIGGVLAMLMRSQLAFPLNDLLDHKTYAEAFTMHGTTMMFFFAVPIMEGFAVYLIPKMIGARDLIYPRLSSFGYWCYLFGGILIYSSFLVDAVPDGGWFMYVPLNSKEFTPGSNADFWLLGVTFAEISAVAAGVELIVAILKSRTAGMAIHKMPIYCWAILVTAFMIVFAFPPLILASILLEIERAFGLPFFDAAKGGDPLLWQHLFWIFGHPEVYIIFLPAAGLVSTILPTFARRPLAAYTWVVMALIATGFISFGLWVHHMFAVGIPLLSLAFFSAASMAVVIPTGIQVFSWIGTLWNGKPVLRVPLLYILGFLFIFVLGGLTGVMVALVPFDWQVHDTHFVVAHLHYVLFGGMVFPLFAAFYYWLPMFSGRMPSDRLSHLAFWMIFMGFNITFLPMHVTGIMGMPRRSYTYLPEMGWEYLNLISTVGGFISAAGIGMLIVDFLLHFLHGKRCGQNPWKAGTLDWAIAVPVPPYNFVALPVVTHREPLWADESVAERSLNGKGFLGHTNVHQRETLMSSALRGEPENVVVLPGNTITPFVAAVFTGLFFVGFVSQIYALSVVGAVLAVGALFVWAWQGGIRNECVAFDAGEGCKLNLHYANPRSPGWWGTLIALLADGTLFASLIFAYFFLWTLSPQWPPTGYRDMSLLLPTAAMGMLLVASVLIEWGERSNRAGHTKRLQLGYLIAAALGVAYIVLQVMAIGSTGFGAREHAYGALVYTITGFQFVHVGAAVLMSVFIALRVWRGYISPLRPSEPAVVKLFWHYTVLQWLLGYGVIHVFPFLA
ncbi:MAG TPA: cytochrome c oxidase subunit I [Noviherbaspirillum sp.]|nr:cytochrome c oxidase subunit I [Noviherbaspirillum sp.]